MTIWNGQTIVMNSTCYRGRVSGKKFSDPLVNYVRTTREFDMSCSWNIRSISWQSWPVAHWHASFRIATTSSRTVHEQSAHSSRPGRRHSKTRLVDWYRNKGSCFFVFWKFEIIQNFKKNTRRNTMNPGFIQISYIDLISRTLFRNSVIYIHRDSISKPEHLSLWNIIDSKLIIFSQFERFFIPNLRMHNILNAKLNMALLRTFKCIS